MPDDPETIMHGSHIDISSDTQIAFWCEKFGVNPITLYSAVRAVGGSPRFVGLYIDTLRDQES